MKYLFFDYDGTLACNGTVSDKNKEYLAKAREAGHKIFLNTGRSKGNMPSKVLREIEWDGMICGGGYMEYEGKVLFEEQPSLDLLNKSLKYAENKGVRVIYEAIDKVYVNGVCEDCEDIYEYLPFTSELHITNITVCTAILSEEREIFSEGSVCELPTYFEIMKKGISKKTGLEYIEKNLGVAHEDIIVFGDSENDIEMLKFAQTAVIMKGAPETLDKYATLRTESETDGVAEGLIKLLKL